MDQVKYLKLEKHVKNGTIRSNGGGGKRFSILKYNSNVPPCTPYIFFENLSKIILWSPWYMIATKLFRTADLVNFRLALIDRETLKGINVFLFYLHVIFVQFSHEFNCFSFCYILVLFQSVIFLRVSWKKYNNNYFLKIGYVFCVLFFFPTEKSQFVWK